MLAARILAFVPNSQTARLSRLTCGQWLVVWLLIRTCAWMALVLSVYSNPPLDLVEWLSWGGSLEWGYSKHPPFPAWMANLFARLSPGDVWGVYLLSYLCSALCLLAAWVVARQYLPEHLALIAVLSLDGLVYLTHDIVEYSNNVVLDVGWAWTIACALRALQTQSIRWWVALGIAVGLSILTKYTIVILLMPLLGYMLFAREARHLLYKPGVYISILIAGLIAAPHLYWLISNDWITLKYADSRSEDERGIIGHLLNPVMFILGQSLLLVLGVFILLPLMQRPMRLMTLTEGKADPRFLHAAVLGPIGILLLISLTSGSQLRQIWGSPLWTLSGVWLLVMFRAEGAQLRVRASFLRWGLVVVAVFAGSGLKQWMDPLIMGKPARHVFPGQALTAQVTDRWHARFSEPFAIVGGDGWIAGNVCVFAKHRPILYSSGHMGYLVLEPEHCPWTSDDEFNRLGGIIVWDITTTSEAEAEDYLRQRFPRIEFQPPVEIPYPAAWEFPNARFGLAFLPPSSSPSLARR